jgi:hypothetical protein
LARSRDDIKIGLEEPQFGENPNKILKGIRNKRIPNAFCLQSETHNLCGFLSFK